MKETVHLQGSPEFVREANLGSSINMSITLLLRACRTPAESNLGSINIFHSPTPPVGGGLFVIGFMIVV